MSPPKVTIGTILAVVSLVIISMCRSVVVELIGDLSTFAPNPNPNPNCFYSSGSDARYFLILRVH